MSARFAVAFAVALAAAAAGCQTDDGSSEPAPPSQGACICIDPWSGATRCCISSPDQQACLATVTECNPWFISNTECSAVGGYRPCATR